MPIIEEKSRAPLVHNVVIEGRKKVMITGVTQVDSFDEQTVVLVTGAGELTIKGSGLHISQLNVDSGELNVTGRIIGLVYSDNDRKAGFFSKVFR